MGFFDVFKTIGSGISSAVSTVGHGISKVATGANNSVLKPVYNSVIKPIGKPIGKVFSKGEALVDKGLDFFGAVHRQDGRNTGQPRRGSLQS